MPGFHGPEYRSQVIVGGLGQGDRDLLDIDQHARKTGHLPRRRLISQRIRSGCGARVIWQPILAAGAEQPGEQGPNRAHWP